MDPAAPLLLFDSGVGGLSVLAPTRALLPTANIVYCADSAGFPYGMRSDSDLAMRVPELLRRIVADYHPRLVVIACNTASTIALDHARAALDIPVVGTVPAIKPAAKVSRSRVIGVLGTEATVRQRYVDDLAARFAADCMMIRHGSPELVELGEAKLRGEPVSSDAIRAAIEPLVAADTAGTMDVIVLACTHFPLLADEISTVLPGVMLVDGAAGIARRIAVLTHGQPWPSAPGPGIALFTAPPPPDLIASLRRFGLDEVRLI